MSIQLFWPSSEYSTGFVFGWTEGCICVVAGVLGLPSVSEAKSVIRSLQRRERNADDLFRSLSLLGHCSQALNCKKDHVSWPRVNWTSEALTNKHSNYILYRRYTMKSMRFYSIEPFDMDVVSVTRQAVSKKMNIQHRLDQIYLPNRLHRICHDCSIDRLSFNIIHEINAADSVIADLHDHLRAHPITRTPPGKRTVLFIARSARNFTINVFSVMKMLFNISMCPLGSETSLANLVDSFQQADIRLDQATSIAQQFLPSSTCTRKETAEVAAQYISFYNQIWLILNDIIIGTAFGAFLCENNQQVAEFLVIQVKSLTADQIKSCVIWLDSWPAGLKLNTELSAFFRLVLIEMIVPGEFTLRHLAAYLPIIVHVIGVAGYCGFTMTLSLFSDLLSLMTAHLYVPYMVFTILFRQQLRMIASLFNLFRGKRYNVLRDRVDSWNYDVDQLLLGTILFTLLAFLFPTVLSYYVLFAVTRLATLFLHAFLETIMAFLNHFPLFTLMLRMKDPSRLPGGIILMDNSKGAEGSSCLLLENSPISFSKIFFQYLLLWSRLSAHYDLRRVLRCMLMGEYLTPITRSSTRYQLRLS